MDLKQKIKKLKKPYRDVFKLLDEEKMRFLELDNKQAGPDNWTKEYIVARLTFVHCIGNSAVLFIQTPDDEGPLLDCFFDWCLQFKNER